MKKYIWLFMVIVPKLYSAVPSSLTGFIDQEIEGFAGAWSTGTVSHSQITGGRNGDVYHVESLSDNENCDEKSDWTKGTLRCAVERKNAPYWIVFDLSGTISLGSELKIQSDKTLDGRGQNITITDNTTSIGECKDWDFHETECAEGIYSVKNVIITNLNFYQVNEAISKKAIEVNGAEDIWIHKNSFYRWQDGMVYIRNNSRNATLSWNRFEIQDRDKPQSAPGIRHRAILIGISRGSGSRVTVHHNYFNNILNRTPKIANSSKVHVYNNFMNEVDQANAWANSGGKMLLEYNSFKGGRNKDYVHCEDLESGNGYIKLDGNWFDTDDPSFWFISNKTACGSEMVFNPGAYYSYNTEKSKLILEMDVFTKAGAKGSFPPMKIILKGHVMGENDESFYMSESEITQSQYYTMMSKRPSNYEFPLSPVENLTFHDAALYCNALSEQEGLDTVNGYSDIQGEGGEGCYLTAFAMEKKKNGYRLPTWEEWKYAYRAGTNTNYYWGDGLENGIYENAWIDENATRHNPIATKIPNSFGLFDMVGNVSEWVWDEGGRGPIGVGGSYESTMFSSELEWDGVSNTIFPTGRFPYGGFRVVKNFKRSIVPPIVGPLLLN